ncbi:MAG: response regulator [Bacteroidota bacterium]
MEDDMVSQFASRYCLEQFAKETFIISTFDSAEVALEAFQKRMAENEVLPELIFLDLGLDEMDGWGFLEALQILLKDKTIPEIYILSAFGKAKDRELAQNHPLVLGYIDKPLTRNRLEKIFETRKV